MSSRIPGLCRIQDLVVCFEENCFLCWASRSDCQRQGIFQLMRMRRRVPPSFCFVLENLPVIGNIVASRFYTLRVAGGKKPQISVLTSGNSSNWYNAIQSIWKTIWRNGSISYKTQAFESINHEVVHIFFSSINLPVSIAMLVLYLSSIWTICWYRRISLLHEKAETFSHTESTCFFRPTLVRVWNVGI